MRLALEVKVTGPCERILTTVGFELPGTLDHNAAQMQLSIMSQGTRLRNRAESMLNTINKYSAEGLRFVSKVDCIISLTRHKEKQT